MKKKIIAAAGLAALSSMAFSSVALADQAYIPWYAANSKEEEEAMTKTVRQTIKYVDKDTGKQMAKDTKDNVQVLTFHRDEEWDKDAKQATGVYTDWDGPKSTKSVNSYKYPGYTASKKVVSAHTYNADDEDQVITVYYTKNPVKKSTQKRTVTRTIKIYRPKKGVKKVVQKATIKRTVKTDVKDHFKTYGKWSNAYWKAYKVPHYKGYKASKKTVKKERVIKTIRKKSGMVQKINNKVVKITYKKIK